MVCTCLMQMEDLLGGRPGLVFLRVFKADWVQDRVLWWRFVYPCGQCTHRELPEGNASVLGLNSTFKAIVLSVSAYL